MLVVQWLGAVALVVFGVRFLRKGLDRLFGARLVRWLGGQAQRPFRALLGGVAAGTVAPSTTAWSMVAVQMVRRQPIAPEPILAVLLGAHIGTTVMVQLLTLRLADYWGLLLALGVVGYQFFSRPAIRAVGQGVIGLGCIFLALQGIGKAAAILGTDADFQVFMRILDHYPLLVMLAAAGLGVTLQSSTAAIGLAIGAVSSGLLSTGMLLAWAIGANVGLGITTLAAGWPSPEGRHLGLASLLGKMVVAILGLIFLPTLTLYTGLLPGSQESQIAWFHTFFNVIVAVVCFPFLHQLIRFSQSLSRSVQSNGAEAGVASKPTTHLDDKALVNPPLALAHATRELQEMADAALEMLRLSWQAQRDQSVWLAESVQRRDDQIDEFNKRITAYLSRIGEGLHPHEARWQFSLLEYANELEAMGDVLDRNICDTLRKQIDSGFHLTVQDSRDLDALYARTIERFEAASALLATHDPNQAAAFLLEKEPFASWGRELQRAHHERLKAKPSSEALASSLYFMDLVGSLRRIHSHACAIGYAFLDEKNEPARVVSTLE